MTRTKRWWFDDPAVKVLFTAGGASSYRGLRSHFLAPRTLVGAEALKVFFESSAPLFASRRVLLVTDEGMRSEAQKLISSFQKEGFGVEMWAGVAGEAPLSCIYEGVREAEAFGPDLLLAFGGGSVIDVLKAVWILYERPDLALNEVHPLKPLGLRKKALMMVIPTTSGTGSESTSAAVITDDEETPPVKISLMHPEIVPDFAIIDSRYALKMPAKLAAGTGLDALTHAIEAFISTWSTDYTEALALKAARLVFQYLPRSVASAQDREARHKMHIAGNLAGLAFSNAAPCLAHSAGHAFGKLFQVHHGIAVGLFLPYVLQYQSKVTSRGEQMARELGFTRNGEEKPLQVFLERIRLLYREIGGPLSGRELVDEQMFAAWFDELCRMASEDPVTTVSVRPINETGYRRFMEAVYRGQDITA